MLMAMAPFFLGHFQQLIGIFSIGGERNVNPLGKISFQFVQTYLRYPSIDFYTQSKPPQLLFPRLCNRVFSFMKFFFWNFANLALKAAIGFPFLNAENFIKCLYYIFLDYWLNWFLYNLLHLWDEFDIWYFKRVRKSFVS